MQLCNGFYIRETTLLALYAIFFVIYQFSSKLKTDQYLKRKYNVVLLTKLFHAALMTHVIKSFDMFVNIYFILLLFIRVKKNE